MLTLTSLLSLECLLVLQVWNTWSTRKRPSRHFLDILLQSKQTPQAHDMVDNNDHINNNNMMWTDSFLELISFFTFTQKMLNEIILSKLILQVYFWLIYQNFTFTLIMVRFKDCTGPASGVTCLGHGRAPPLQTGRDSFVTSCNGKISCHWHQAIKKINSLSKFQCFHEPKFFLSLSIN